MKYTIEITTGDRGGAAASGSAGITIVGSLGRIQDHTLPHRRRLSFRRAATDRFEIESSDLGDLLYIELFALGKPWFVSQVKISDEGMHATLFPVHGWVERVRRIVFEGSAKLPQHEDAATAAARATELSERREVYEWNVPANGLPPHLEEQNVDLLPRDELFTEERDESLAKFKKRAEWDLKAAAAFQLFDPFDAPMDEGHLYPLLPRPSIADRYSQDVEFGYLSVASVVPTHVYRVNDRSKLPDVWSDALAIEAIEKEVGPLDQAARSGKLYYVNDDELADIPMYDDGSHRRYAPPASCIYTVTGGNLIPFAIRLEPGGTIFRKSDGASWQLAKTYFATAEANVHQIVTHATRTHLALEPYAMATMRQLSSRHPLFKLLRRHFQGTMRINAEARNVLLGSGGIFDQFIATGGPKAGHLQLAAKQYAIWSLPMNDVENDLESRGFGRDASGPLNYPYADDARDLSAAIRGYVNATLDLYYIDDRAIAQDTELAAWFDELKQYGRPGTFGDALTKQSVADIVATVIFTGSVQHSAVNFGQYEHFGYIPNAPAAMRVLTPVNVLQAVSDLDWMTAYPDFNQTARQLFVSYSLSRYVEDEEYLLPPAGGWKESYFVEDAPNRVIESFHAALREVKERVVGRNQSRLHPYEWLLPDAVPTSISI